ncbi:MAG: hypothetical protein ACI9LE_000464 [Paraglaciecola sp.]|jgi:hypothetical protein
MQIHPIQSLSTLFIYFTLSGLGATEKSLQTIYVGSVSEPYQAVQKANVSSSGCSYYAIKRSLQD